MVAFMSVSFNAAEPAQARNCPEAATSLIPTRITASPASQKFAEQAKPWRGESSQEFAEQAKP